MVSVTLRVCFEDPFWICEVAREEHGMWQCAKIVFGAEPKDGEVLERVMAMWQDLCFTPFVPAKPQHTASNPKRRQRQAARELQKGLHPPKAREALSRQRELQAQAVRERRKRTRGEEAERRYALSQRKRKEKHRGH